MLVVFVIVGLISTLLFQGLTYVFQLRARFLNQLTILQQGELQQYWFYSSTAAIVTDYRNGQHVFQGKPKEFSGLTLAALDAKTGVPMPFTWQLQREKNNMVLRYRNSQNQAWDIMRWLGKAGYFRYRDLKGQWHTQWPPPVGHEDIVQLPVAILLVGQQDQKPIAWFIKLTDYPYSRIDYQASGDL